jgi:hypothetical protein
MAFLIYLKVQRKGCLGMTVAAFSLMKPEIPRIGLEVAWAE